MMLRGQVGRFKPNRSDKNQGGRKQCVHLNRGKNLGEQRGIFLERCQVSQNNHFRHSSDGKKDIQIPMGRIHGGFNYVSEAIHFARFLIFIPFLSLIF